MPEVSMEYTISRCLQDNILTSPSYLKKKIRLCSNNHWQCRKTSVPQYKTLKSAYRRLIFRCSVNEVTRLIEITFTRLLVYIIKCDLFVLLMFYDFVIDRNCLLWENIGVRGWGAWAPRTGVRLPTSSLTFCHSVNLGCFSCLHH